MKHASPDHPFPGLRPFEIEDSKFFFGRDDHITSLQEKLLLNRFVAVVGSSGSGKSSLVRAGLLGRLDDLKSADGNPTWKAIVMRPLGQPLAQLASEIAREHSLSVIGAQKHQQPRQWTDLAERALTKLSRSSFGLVELLSELVQDHAPRLLIIVDQFEELFRYSSSARTDEEFDERALFVKHLLRAAADPALTIHVLITMRSEFIGDCAQFPGLPEAISDSQFLTPRLTRSQRRNAVVGPLELAGGDIAPALLQRILNDVGHEVDQLPVMQHALMRTWQATFPSRSLTLQAYESIGTMESAISIHAEDLLQKRTDVEGAPLLRTETEKRDLERVLRALTEVDKDGRAVRRPTRFIDLAGQCSTPEAAAAIIDVFRDEDCAFLSPNKSTPLDDDTIVDITHEALIRKWTTLARWVEREADDGKNILRLQEVAARRKSDPEFVLGPRETAERSRWWEESKPTPEWARRYLRGDDAVTFEDVHELLEASAETAARSARLERDVKESQLAAERLLRERAEREARQRETELELEQMARKLAESQRQRLASQVPVHTGKLARSIYVSFAREDRRAAIEIHDWLLKQGCEDVFLDLGDPETVRSFEVIRRSRCVILLFSPAWVDSRHCRRELEIARENGVHLIVVRISQFLPSDAAQTEIEDIRIATDWTKEGGRERLKIGLAQIGLLAEYFPYVSDRSPYPGLAGFDEEDASVFFGRSTQIADALDRLEFYRRSGGCHVLSILGASGAGKSSFLRAGIWPRLKRNRASYLCLPIQRPHQWATGEHNLMFERNAVLGVPAPGHENTQAKEDEHGEILEGELVAYSREVTRQIGGEMEDGRVTVVLAIDQAEELFRPDHASVMKLFKRRIASIVLRDRVPLIVIFSMRSDCFELLQADSDLGNLRMDVFSLPPLPVGAISEIIEGPARVAGLQIESQLVERLLNDLEPSATADALPLLAFILERLYRESSSSGRLALIDYEALGGFRGAIELAIERALERARSDQRVPRGRDEITRLLKLAFIPALVAIDPDSRLPRRRLARLSEIPSEAHPILDHLVQERLLVAGVQGGEGGKAVFEIAHEAILRQWGTLRAWIDEDLVLLRVLEDVRRAARDWHSNDQDDAWLVHSSARLEEASYLLERSDFRFVLDASDKAYLDAARARQEAAISRQRSRQRVLASGAIVFLIVALLALGAALFAYAQIMLATEQRLLAEAANLRAGSSISPDARFMLTLDVHGRARMINLVTDQDVGTLEMDNGRITSVAFSPDGTRVATAANTFDVGIWDADTLAPIAILRGQTDTIRRIVFSPDGALLASGGDDGSVRVWSVATGDLYFMIPTRGAIVSIAFSPDGKSLTISTEGGTLYTADVGTGAIIKRIEPSQ
jgi:hypothetical protein